MDDLIKTIKAQLYDRLSSPLIFSFTIAWLLWNYKFSLILLSTISPAEKFDQIDQLWRGSATFISCWRTFQIPDWIAYWGFHGLIGPATTTALYIFGLPRIEAYIFKFTLTHKLALKSIRQEAEDKTPLTQEEARELRAALISAQAEFESTIAAKQAEITRLKTEAAEARAEWDRKASVKPTPPERTMRVSAINDGQADLLKYIADADEPVAASAIFAYSSLSKIETQYNIDQLKRHDFIEDDEFGLVVTSKGIAYLVEHKVGGTTTARK